jgi:hypothetical protein
VVAEWSSQDKYDLRVNTLTIALGGRPDRLAAHVNIGTEFDAGSQAAPEPEHRRPTRKGKEIVANAKELDRLSCFPCPTRRVEVPTAIPWTTHGGLRATDCSFAEKGEAGTSRHRNE